MCERLGFWQWLAQVSVEAVRAVPGVLVGTVRAVPEVARAIPRLVMTTFWIRNPFYEFFTGMMVLVIVLALLPAPDLTLDVRIVSALLSIPSFLLVMHTVYRSRYGTWVDC